MDLLHVGSTVPRKRIDALLRIFAGVKGTFANARLIRVGGPFTEEQNAMVARLGLAGSIVVLPHLERPALGAVYRRAALTLLPSEREGFGLPVVESMACGTPVVASDLPALREAGGTSAYYCPMSDIENWTARITTLLRERCDNPTGWADLCRSASTYAGRFSWGEYARRMTAIYAELHNSTSNGWVKE
jgi:glycosyltransferase involved in cell wall biosynthesis